MHRSAPQASDDSRPPQLGQCIDSDESVITLRTHYQVGTVSPFGLKSPIPVIADRNIFHPPAVSLGSGVPNTAILMRTEDLKQALGEIETGSFAED